MERTIEHSIQRVLRNHRSCSKHKLNKVLVFKNRIKVRRSKNSGDCAKNNDSNEIAGKNMNIDSSSGETDSATINNVLTTAKMVHSSEILTGTSPTNFQLASENEDSTKNKASIEDDLSYGGSTTAKAIAHSNEESNLKSKLSPICRKRCYSVDESCVSSCTSTFVLTYVTTSIDCETSHKGNDLEQTSIQGESGNKKETNTSVVTLKKQDRSRKLFQNRINNTVEAEFKNEKNPVEKSEEWVQNSKNSLHPIEIESDKIVNNLAQMQRKMKNAFTDGNDDENNEGTKIMDVSISNSDSGNSSGFDANLENFTGESIEIELNSNSDDKLIACLAGIDLTNLNIEVENEGGSEAKADNLHLRKLNQNEVESTRKEESAQKIELVQKMGSIQNENSPNQNVDFIHNQNSPNQNVELVENEIDFITNEVESDRDVQDLFSRPRNLHQSSENSQEVLIESVNDTNENTILLTEDLIEMHTETAHPPRYYVYQIPCESIEMAIQVTIPSTNNISVAIPSTEVPIAVPTYETYELCEIEVSNGHDELPTTDLIPLDGGNLENDQNFILECDSNVIIQNGRKPISEDEKILKNAIKSTAKNVTKRSSIKISVSRKTKPIKNSLRKTRRGRPKGSKNLTFTDEHLYSPDIFYCDLCPNKIFKSRLGLKKHINRHLTNKMRQKCALCDQRPKNLDRHITMKHSDVRHKCDFCDASFKNKENQLIHMRTHTGERPFVCKFGTCGMSFRAQATCRKHENRVHRFLKKHRCDDCGRSFHSPYLLEDHIYAFHTGERNYACDLCGKCFATRRYLRTHKITHGEKVHKCRHCEKMFALADNRRKHERRFHKIK